MTQAPTPSHPPEHTKRPWYRKGWVHLTGVAVLALLIGIAIGAGGASPTDSPEYKKLDDELSATQDDLAAQKVATEKAEAESKALAGDIPERETAVAAKESELVNREMSVEKAEKAVLKREKAVGIVEHEIAQNTIPGDGVYEVGRDMKAGQYRSTENADCYYAITSDANGENIITNHIGSGPIIANVAVGQFFNSQGCSDWVLDAQ